MDNEERELLKKLKKLRKRKRKSEDAYFMENDKNKDKFLVYVVDVLRRNINVYHLDEDGEKIRYCDFSDNVDLIKERKYDLIGECIKLNKSTEIIRDLKYLLSEESIGIFLCTTNSENLIKRLIDDSWGSIGHKILKKENEIETDLANYDGMSPDYHCGTPGNGWSEMAKDFCKKHFIENRLTMNVNDISRLFLEQKKESYGDYYSFKLVLI